jgi:signal transduction histidine kinase
LTPTHERSLTEGLAHVRAGELRAGHPLVRIDLGTDPPVLVFQVADRSSSERPAAIGFVADLSFVTGLFERILAESPLLPSSLDADTRNRLAIRIKNPEGREVFASSSNWSPYASETVLDRELGGLRLAVALDPTAADTLIIGGLPRSRLPMLVGLIVLTGGLVLTAIVQLRREHELTRLRAHFVSGVSHELRTPLAQIRMFGETLMLGRVRSDVERQRSLAIIVQESQRLTRLIENLLHFSRAERGVAAVSLVPTRIDLLLHEIVDAFAPLASSKRALIARHIEQGLTVPVDAGALRQITLNLLDNALKYGPSGQTITVSATYEDTIARIAVQDQGPGVQPEHAARIWQPFYRVATHARETGGTGIGLAIVKQLVGLHHGRVSVESTGSAGSRFAVELPGATLAQETTVWSKAAAGM